MLARSSLTKESAKSAANHAPAPKSPQSYFAAKEEPEEVLAPGRFSWSFGDIALSAPSDSGPRPPAENARRGSPTAKTGAPLPWPLQAKLEVGATDDPLEREADRVAEQVMCMPDRTPLKNAAASSFLATHRESYPALSDSSGLVQRKCACGGTCDTCKSEQADDEHEIVQRKSAIPTEGSRIVQPIPQMASRGAWPAHGGMQAPRIVQEVLRSPGQPLDSATRAFFEPRFGHDLTDVRVHSDAQAAHSAALIGAAGYTFGPHIILGHGRTPSSASTRDLLAHELAHVIQQSANLDRTIRRKPCMEGSDCKFIPGDTGRFVERIRGHKKGEVTVEFSHVEVLEPDTTDPSGKTATPPPSRQGMLATNLRKLVESSGFKIPPEASGPFIDEGLSASVGAQAPMCRDFPDGVPKGAPKDGCCIQVYPEMENRAKRLLNSKSPRTPAQDADALDLISTVLHEAEHCQFNVSPQTAEKIPAESDCNLGTIVFHGPLTGFDFNVKFYLSELSAIIAEFPPYFQNFKASPTKANHDLLHRQEIQMALNQDESIRGIIHGLKCACSCDSVDKLVENAVRNAMSSWPKDQARKFLEAMARIMPSWWPKGLQNL